MGHLVVLVHTSSSAARYEKKCVEDFIFARMLKFVSPGESQPLWTKHTVPVDPQAPSLDQLPESPISGLSSSIPPLASPLINLD